MFEAMLGGVQENVTPQTGVYRRGAKRLFGEALTLYLQAMRQRNMLNREDKQLLLVAIHGLTQLNNYPLARTLIRLSFSYLTAEEMLEWLERSRQAQRDLECEVPF